MSVAWVMAAAAAGVLVLLVLAGHRLLTGPRRHGGGMADALGNFIDVYDPARARATLDLESRKHRGEVLPAPDGDDPGRLRVDLAGNRVRLPRRP